MHCVRGSIPQALAGSNCVFAIMTACHEIVLTRGKNQETAPTIYIPATWAAVMNTILVTRTNMFFVNFQHRPTNMACTINPMIICYGVPLTESVTALLVTHEDGLNNAIERTNPAHEKVRIHQSPCVCNRDERNSVCCFCCGQQGEDDNNEIIEPLCSNLCLKVIRYLSINSS